MKEILASLIKLALTALDRRTRNHDDALRANQGSASAPFHLSDVW
jgi:hypothetical protein